MAQEPGAVPEAQPDVRGVWVYETLGKDGDIILDPFLGSGPTLAAAEKTNRSVRALEMSEAYVAFCLQRLADLGLEPRRVERQSPAEDSGAGEDSDAG